MVVPALDVPRLVTVSVVMWLIYRRYCDCRASKEQLALAATERAKYRSLVYGDQ